MENIYYEDGLVLHLKYRSEPAWVIDLIPTDLQATSVFIVVCVTFFSSKDSATEIIFIYYRLYFIGIQIFSFFRKPFLSFNSLYKLKNSKHDAFFPLMQVY